MAVLTSQGVARTAVGLLSRSIVLPNTVTRVTRDDFPAGNGATNVPSGDRYLAVSPDIATRLLSLEGLRDASQAGDSNALRQATIGQVFGFTVVESNALTAGTAVAYHRNAFAFANVLPATPR